MRLIGASDSSAMPKSVVVADEKVGVQIVTWFGVDVSFHTDVKKLDLPHIDGRRVE